MKANNAARIATKQQLEVLVSKLTEYTKRKPLREAEGAVAGAPAPTAAPASAAPAAVTPPTASPAPKPATPDPNAKQKQEVEGVPTLANIVDQLNTLRAGRSLKDEEVKVQIQRYFDGLDDSEKEAMHAYLKGIAQILSGQVDAGAAEEPKNHGVSTQTSGKRSKNIKPNVIRKQASPTLPGGAGAAASAVAATPPRENTTPPSPIVPKKR
jgi:hypothetical protein